MTQLDAGRVVRWERDSSIFENPLRDMLNALVPPHRQVLSVFAEKNLADIDSIYVSFFLASASVMAALNFAKSLSVR